MRCREAEGANDVGQTGELVRAASSRLLLLYSFLMRAFLASFFLTYSVFILPSMLLSSFLFPVSFFFSFSIFASSFSLLTLLLNSRFLYFYFAPISSFFIFIALFLIHWLFSFLFFSFNLFLVTVSCLPLLSFSFFFCYSHFYYFPPRSPWTLQFRSAAVRNVRPSQGQWIYCRRP